jgi:hypothetical protein
MTKVWLFNIERYSNDEFGDTPLYFWIIERTFGHFRFFSAPTIAVGVPLGVVAKLGHGTLSLWCPSLGQSLNSVGVPGAE